MTDEATNGESLEAFRLARARLKRDFGARGAAKALFPIFSPATLTRLLKGDKAYAAEKFSPAVRERLVWLFDVERHMGLYHGIEELMEHTDIGRSIIFRDYVGDYSIFRFAAFSGSFLAGDEAGQDAGVRSLHPELRFVRETLRIRKDAVNEPAYEYETHETPKDGIIIKGAVFYALGHLFLPGLSKDTMSLSIVSANRATGWMHGFWTSVGKRGAGAPFSSRFLMVNRANREIIDRLEGPEGERAFFEIAGGDYAYYMSI